MTDYTIIDEPKPGKFNHLIISPLIIMFASILVPLFINLPYFGRIWIPAVWLVANGLFLGSASIVKEIIMAIAAVALWFAIIFGSVYLSELLPQSINFQSIFPYSRILSQAIFFFFLMYIVNLQSTAYSLYEYMHKGNK